MGEQRGFAPLLTVDLAFVTVDLNLRESGARFPCKWSSVLEIYTAEFWAIIISRIDPRNRADRRRPWLAVRWSSGAGAVP